MTTTEALLLAFFLAHIVTQALVLKQLGLVSWHLHQLRKERKQ